MFNLFKKKGETAASAKQEQAAEVAAALDLDKEIVVHAMPERFRQSNPGAGRAKKTGMLILVLGLVILVLAGGGFYYFLFIYQAGGSPIATSTAETAVVPTTTETPEQEPPAQRIEQPVEVAAPTSTVPIAVGPDAATSSSADASAAAEPDNQPSSLVTSPDTDTDGITDAEENLLGSNPSAADSDGDGFSDLGELNNLYDPAGAGKLSDSRRFKTYSNKSFNYSVIEPVAWPVSTVGGDYTVIFTIQGETTTGDIENQLIQIDVQPNIKKRSVVDWYKEQFNLPAVDPARLIEQKGKTGEINWLGIKSDDGRTIYLVDAKLNYLVTLNYNLGLSNKIEYPNIFNAMIKSFLFGS